MLQLLPTGGEDLASWIFQFLFLLFIILFSLYGQRFQLWIWINQIKASLLQLKQMDVQGRRIVIHMIKELGKPDFDPTQRVDELRETFFIEPVDKDPVGVLKRLEHLLDIMKENSTFNVKQLAPKASSEVLANIENTLEASMALYQIYRIIRHFFLLGKRNNNIFFIAQIQMQLPQIMKIAKAYFQALRAFADGIPIGDSIGPLVVSLLEWKHASCDNLEVIKTPARDIYASKFKIKNRDVFILRATGPGGRVGKPGEAVFYLVKNNPNIKRIVTVDAALKLEGEKTGSIAEGIGAAIGDPGPEKYKIEQIATQTNIPLDAVIVKQSIEEAVTPMRKEIFSSAEKVVSKLEHIIETRVKENEGILIAGIGNSGGIGYPLKCGDSNE